jgi:hypothetical protein
MTIFWDQLATTGFVWNNRLAEKQEHQSSERGWGKRNSRIATWAWRDPQPYSKIESTPSVNTAQRAEFTTRF